MTLTRTEAMAAERARELIVFADGIEDAGHPELARRSRLTAHDLLDVLPVLAAERAARLHIQADRDRILKLRFPGAYT